MKTTRPVTSSKIKKARTSPEESRQKTRQIDGLMRLMTQTTGTSVLFEIASEPGNQVYVAGTFNNWDPTVHPLTCDPTDGVFRAALLLPVGTHEYRFVVDGVWQMDDKNPSWAPNGHGTLNSVIKV